MYITAATLDDLLIKVYQKLLKSKIHIKPSKGAAIEIPGALLQITNPRARLSRTEKRGRTLFSCLGELLWYMSGTNELDFITYYISLYEEFSDDGTTIYGGYGPRLFNNNGINQVQNVIELLKKKLETRQAVIQLFHAQDLEEPHKDIPCTCTLQFLVRQHRLHMVTYMRSNDAFWGLPHDVFSFTMLQEMVARSINVELGTYKHSVGSLHLYEDKVEDAQQFIKEGLQSKIAMPAMPSGDPFPSISLLLQIEEKLRKGKFVDISQQPLDNYWTDLVRLLQIFRLVKDRKFMEIKSIKSAMFSDVYHTYITRKQSQPPLMRSQDSLAL